MYKAFIEPDLKKAHLRIYNTFNPFSGFMNATYILKSSKHVSVNAIREALPVSARPHRDFFVVVKFKADMSVYIIGLLRITSNAHLLGCTSTIR